MVSGILSAKGSIGVKMILKAWKNIKTKKSMSITSLKRKITFWYFKNKKKAEKEG